jgi:hypothetical protein
LGFVFSPSHKAFYASQEFVLSFFYLDVRKIKLNPKLNQEAKVKINSTSIAKYTLSRPQKPPAGIIAIFFDEQTNIGGTVSLSSQHQSSFRLNHQLMGRQISFFFTLQRAFYSLLPL